MANLNRLTKINSFDPKKFRTVVTGSTAHHRKSFIPSKIKKILFNFKFFIEREDFWGNYTANIFFRKEYAKEYSSEWVTLYIKQPPTVQSYYNRINFRFEINKKSTEYLNKLRNVKTKEEFLNFLILTKNQYFSYAVLTKWTELKRENRCQNQNIVS